jgi:flavodoxin short chain
MHITLLKEKIMTTLNIIYWSGTGNTEEMANLISDGASMQGTQTSLIPVDEASIMDVANADIVALGCPSMGDEVLEEQNMEPFVESIKDLIKGKKVALFGSYGWGDGQWMRDWVERMQTYGALLIDDGLIIQGSPDSSSQECIDFGKKIAAA